LAAEKTGQVLVRTGPYPGRTESPRDFRQRSGLCQEI